MYKIIRESEFTVRGVKTIENDNYWDVINETKVIFESNNFEEFIEILDRNFYNLKLNDISKVITEDVTKVHLTALDCYHHVYSNSDWCINVKYFIEKTKD